MAPTVYQALSVSSPGVDEKTVFLGEDAATFAQERQNRPTVGHRIARRFAHISVGLLAILGLLQLITLTPMRHYTPAVLDSLARHGSGHHGQGHRHGPPHHGGSRHLPHGPWHGPGPHDPSHRGPPPFFHPRPIECFDLSESTAAVNFSVTLPHPGAPLHLSPTLGNANVELYSDGADKQGLIDDLPRPPHPPQPPHLPHGPPGRGPPHPPSPPHFPHSKPQAIVIGVERGEAKASYLTSDDFVDEQDKKKKAEVFICSLELPFRQIGLGLFHEKPSKDQGPGKTPPPPPPSHSSSDKPDDEGKKPNAPPAKQPKHDPFPVVALTIRHPAGEPFTVTSAMPFFHPPPPPPHHGHPPPPPPPNGQQPPHGKGMVVVITTFTRKVCGAGRRFMTTIRRS